MRVSLNTAPAEAMLKKASRALDKPRILDEIGKRLLEWARDNVASRGKDRSWKPFKTAGATQLQTLGSKFTLKKSGDAVTVWNSAGPVAAYHHFGSKKHLIEGKGKALRFRTSDGTKFARIVQHPGLPKRPLIPSRARGRAIAREVVNVAAIAGGFGVR